MRRERLTSLTNPRVKRVVKLRQRRDRDREGVFLVEGYRELRRAVESGLPFEELFVCPEIFLGENEPALIARAEAQRGARVTEVVPEVFRKMTYRDRPEGLLAVLPCPDWTLERIDSGSDPLVIVACSVEKPGNLGTILRCGDAVGAAGVIVCDRGTDLFNPNVVRASLGCLFTVPVAEASTDEALAWLRAHGLVTVATSPDAEVLYTDEDLTGPRAVIVGSEQLGLPERWLTETDRRVRIPMAGDVDSLNVAMATAVVLFEAVRQRGRAR